MTTVNAATFAAYLVHREHAAARAAVAAGRDLAALRADRYFFRTWWLEPLATCAAASPAITDRPEAVLDRVATRFAIRLSDIGLPRCPRCRTPLRWRDVAVQNPTGYCRLCSRPPAHQSSTTPIPAPRTIADRFELFGFDMADLREVA